MKTLSIDVETYSSVSLPECGASKYVEAPDFTILLFAYSVDFGPVQVVDFACGEQLPPEIMEALYDPAVEKTAYNAPFERTTIGKFFNRYCPPEQWDCTLVLAASCGLPLSLAAVSDALGLGEEKGKMKEGKDLIRYFTMPCKPTKKNGGRTRNLPSDDPESWAVFKAYNKRDVEVENTIRQKLLKWRPMKSEHDLWVIDQKINDRGMGVDLNLARHAVEIGEGYKQRLIEKAQEISGLVNPGSTAQVKAWLEEQEGLTVTSLNKKVVADVVAQLSSDNAKEFMALRTEFSKSSTKKYEAIIRSVTSDGHIHGCFQFAGAGRTGRWAGRLVQLQNLPQNHLPDLAEARSLVGEGDGETLELLYPGVQSTLSELIRTALIPEPGCRFIVADYSAIEARVLAWLAGEQWRLDVFQNGGDIYCASASQMFKVPVVKHGENGHLRQKGKVAELALGYGGGVGALQAFGADKLGMSSEDMAETVELWRSASPHVVAMWKSLEKAAIRCVVKKTATISSVGHIRFDYDDGVLWMTLPSGRRVAYWGAEYTENRKGFRSLTYMGTEQKSRKWMRLETWGGKLVENLTQATARDCLKEALLSLAAAGYDVRGHVHDEVIVSEPIGGRTVEEVCAIMGQTPSWAPGLPLRADGYETPYYRKD